MARLMKHALLAAGIVHQYYFRSVQAIRQNWADGNKQCTGKYPDLSRLQSLSDQDISWLTSQVAFSPQVSTSNFSARKVTQVTLADGATCLGERHRLRELVEGIPVFGADFVVTTATCSDYSSFDRNALMDTNTLPMLASNSIVSLSGYKAGFVDVPTGYAPKHSSKEDAITTVSAIYGVAEEKVTTLSLEIYATEDMDYRAWIGTVLVDTVPGEPHVYQIVMDDETDEILLQCEIGGFGRRTLQEQVQSQAQAQNDYVDFRSRVDASACDSCAAFGGGITWQVDQIVECDVQTLYLNNTGRKTLCINGTDNQGNQVIGPGRIPELHWDGTMNCNSQTICEAVPMPACSDAINDVQWGAINYLQYLREHLGVMGGLSKDAENPIPLAGRAHFDYQLCNAFYVPGEHTVYFGDCTCDMFYPLVTTDVVVHEITHGLTSESSGLLYVGESGGLNEAYSDIMGCALEFSVYDEFDTPDFLVGESLVGPAFPRTFLRSMETPSSDGKSLDTFCDHEFLMPVHYSSGFLNRAYFNAVKSCETVCVTSTAHCAILLADIFLYTNMELLSSSSGFKDAARMTCRSVPEFYVARQPMTTCTSEVIRSSIVDGFAAVGLKVNADTCNVSVSCRKKCIFDRIYAAVENTIELLTKFVF